MSLTVEGEEEGRGEGGWGGEENREGEWRSTRERLGGVRRGKRAGGEKFVKGCGRKVHLFKSDRPPQRRQILLKRHELKERKKQML